MLVDLRIEGKAVLVFGGGLIGERKVRTFIEENSKVTVIGKRFTRTLKELGSQEKVKLVKYGLKSDASPITSMIANSDIVVAATDDPKLNRELAEEAEKQKVLISVVDNPSISGFYLPAVARFGEIRVAISTGGRSPAVAKMLRKRLERIITREDILQVELQDHVWKLAKSRILDRRVRRNILYQIIKNPEIKHLLKKEDFDGAKKLAERFIEQ